MTKKIVGRKGGIASTIRGSAVAIALSASVAHADGPSVLSVPGRPLLLLGAYDVGSLGYTAQEFFISGDATSYRAKTALQSDGHWDVVTADSAPYATRLVVIRPEDPSKFNGTVIVEWLNVSGGLDAPADWFMAHRELVREGYAYVAVSAQKVGIEGGASLGMDMSLKKTDPARYGRLAHPGDAFAFDIFSQAGRLLKLTGPDAILGSLTPKRVLAAGESQSAHFMTTYVNAIDPIAKVYDGFLVHSRFSGSAPLDGRSMMAAVAEDMPAVVKFRSDLRVPVITVITETDLIGGARSGFDAARQPDNDRLRTWEIPGTAHADIYTIQVAPIDTGSAPIEKIVAAYAPTYSLMGMKLDEPINFAPQHHYVVEAAISNLDKWVRTGRPAPIASPIDLLEGDQPALSLDANGLAKGGIRTPWIDVPIAVTSGIVKSDNIMVRLFGSSKIFDVDKIRKLYPGGKAEYLDRFEKSLDSSIRAGFILMADRSEIMDLASAQYPGDR